MNRSRIWLACVATLAVLALAGIAWAQTTTYDVRNGQVIAVRGNVLVVRGAEGVRVFDVPEDFRFDMNGQKLSVHELKPGMTLTAIVKTTQTPSAATVTEIKQGEVLYATSNALVVKTQTGEAKKFTIDDVRKQDVLLDKDGKAFSDFSGLKKGDRLTATIVTVQEPTMVTTQQLQIYAHEAPPPKPAPAPAPAVAETTPPPPAEKPPARLPKTAGAVGGLLVFAAAAFGGAALLRARRRAHAAR